MHWNCIIMIIFNKISSNSMIGFNSITSYYNTQIEQYYDIHILYRKKKYIYISCFHVSIWTLLLLLFNFVEVPTTL